MVLRGGCEKLLSQPDAHVWPPVVPQGPCRSAIYQTCSLQHLSNAPYQDDDQFICVVHKKNLHTVEGPATKFISKHVQVDVNKIKHIVIFCLFIWKAQEVWWRRKLNCWIKLYICIQYDRSTSCLTSSQVLKETFKIFDEPCPKPKGAASITTSACPSTKKDVRFGSDTNTTWFGLGKDLG